MGRLLEIPSLRALRHPAYARLIVGALISNIGTWMEAVGVGIYVTQATGKAAWTGGVAALMWLPAAIFAPLGGALGDRVDRRRMIIAINVAQTVLAAVLAALALTDHLSVAAVAIVVFLGGCLNALNGPVVSALLADIVPLEDLLSALSLSSAQWNLGRCLGPALAAAVIAWKGLGWALAFNAVSFLAVQVALASITLPPRKRAAHETLWSTIRAGVTFAVADDLLRPVLGLILALSLLVSPFIGLVPAFAITVLGGGPTATSLMVTCQGAGAIVGALMLGSLAERFGRRRVFELAGLGVGLQAAIYWMAPNLLSASLLLGILGAVYLALLTGAATAMQARVSSSMRGRVAAIYSMVVNGTYAIGLIVMGNLGDRFGLRMVMVISALLFTAGLAAIRALRPTLFVELDRGAAADPLDPQVVEAV